MDPLDAYLQQAHQAGETDSSGTFTLSLQQALARLGRSQLADSGCALLKLLQFACGQGCPSVTLERSGNRLWVHLSEQTPAVDLQALATNLTQLTIGNGHQPLVDLAVGLNWFLHHDSQSVGWCQAGRAVALKGEVPVREGSGFSVYLEGHWLAPLIRSLPALRHRLTFLPMEVHFRSKRLDGHLSGPLPDTIWMRRQWERVDSLQGRLRWPTDGETCQLLIALDSTLESLDTGCSRRDLPERPRVSRIVPVLRGICLDPIFLDTPGGAATLVVCCDALNTDLSHFKLLDNAQIEDLWRTLRPYLAEVYRAAAGDPTLLERMLHTRDDLANVAIPMVPTGLGLGLLVVQTISPVTELAGVMVAVCMAGVGGSFLVAGLRRLANRKQRRQEFAGTLAAMGAEEPN